VFKVIFGVFAVLMLIVTAVSAEEVIFEKESHYHRVRVVVRDNGDLDLRMGHIVHSTIKPGHEDLLPFYYTRTMFTSLALVPEPSRVLFVGLGGGSMVNFFRKYYQDVQIDLVEIDPVVVEVAKNFFSFKVDSRMNVVVEDGRSFLRRSDAKYDLIFLDAYNHESIAFHLTTKEFFENVKEHLSSNGRVVSHYWSEKSNRFLSAQQKTYQAVFNRFLQVRTAGSVIMIAPYSDKDPSMVRLTGFLKKIVEQREMPYRLDSLFEKGGELVGSEEIDAPVLTDDYAPVDILLQQE